MVTEKTRLKIIDAFAELCGEQPPAEVTLSEIAQRAGVTLAQLRDAYGGRFDILADFSRRMDKAVLENLDADLANESPRDRLFDVLFTRIEALEGHRDMIRNWTAAARRDAITAMSLNGILTTSMSWMLAGAGVGATGARNAIRAQALAVIWTRVLRVWIDDDDPGLARTMAELDRQLRRAERAATRLAQFERICDRILEERKGRPQKVDPDKATASEGGT